MEMENVNIQGIKKIALSWNCIYSLKHPFRTQIAFAPDRAPPGPQDWRLSQRHWWRWWRLCRITYLDLDVYIRYSTCRRSSRQGLALAGGWRWGRSGRWWGWCRPPPPPRSPSPGRSTAAAAGCTPAIEERSIKKMYITLMLPKTPVAALVVHDFQNFCCNLQ